MAVERGHIFIALLVHGKNVNFTLIIYGAPNSECIFSYNSYQKLLI